MSDAATPGRAPTGPAVPDQRPSVSRGWVGRYGLMYLGLNVAWAAPSQLLLANQVLAWHPATKELRLGWLMPAGGLAAVVAGPLAGRLSDRSRSPLGRRRPYVLIGTAGAALALVAAGLSGSYWPLLGAWILFQAMLAGAVTLAQTIAPDRVPARQYGLVSGVLGLTYTLAVVLGTLVGASLAIRQAYLVTAALSLALTLPFLLAYREPQESPPTPLDPGVASPGVLRALTGPRYRDLRWVFLARLAVTMAQAIALFYLLYFLRDRVGLADPDGGVLLLSAVYAACVVVTAVLAGWASDRMGRRKPFVVASSLGVAVAAFTMAGTTSWPVVVMAAVVLGGAWGVYQSIDQALINEVLPSGGDRARDMGLMNVAGAVPNTLAPVVAAVLVTRLGGYPVLYSVAGALTVLGALLLLPVRSVR